MRKLIVEFIPAVVPNDGWPDRPWDHRQVSDDSGSVERVAVDQSGAVIRDAEGDEVQSGPGFDFQVAKVSRQGRPAHDDVVPVPVERLSVELVGVLAIARRMGAVFGHAWIGTEHLALALAEHSAEARQILATSWDVAAEAVASFYEGPYAAARLRLVRKRLAEGWEPTPLPNEVSPTPNWALRSLLDRAGTADDAEGQLEADVIDVARLLVAPAAERPDRPGGGPEPLVRRLLGM
jgi:hypothetical protein